MTETPYEAAERVADSADDLDLHDLAENVVDAVLALPNVIVLADPDTPAGSAQIGNVARGLYPMFDAMDEGFQRWALGMARAALGALKVQHIQS